MLLTTLEKTEIEEPTFEMPFEGKIPEGDTILSVTSVTISVYSGSGIATYEGETIFEDSIFIRFLGGVDKSVYLVVVEILTTNGDVLQRHGLLKIANAIIPA